MSSTSQVERKDAPHRSRIYSDLSGIYDHIFTRVFARRIEAVIGGLDLPPGTEILEVGVGTGLSLDAYRADTKVLAIDLSDDMLAHAERKRVEAGYDHIELRQMDALNLEFEDNSFDVVGGFHIITVVPDPHRLLAEMVRVCRPGGRVVIINHFSSERTLIRMLVNLIDPITRLLGWSTRLELSEVLEGSGLTLDRRYKTSPFSLFTIVEARKKA